jgi:hypothetical protein
MSWLSGAWKKTRKFIHTTPIISNVASSFAHAWGAGQMYDKFDQELALGADRAMDGNVAREVLLAGVHRPTYDYGDAPYGEEEDFGPEEDDS